MTRSISSIVLFLSLVVCHVNGVFTSRNSPVQSAMSAFNESLAAAASTKAFLEWHLQKHEEEMTYHEYKSVKDCVMFMDHTAHDITQSTQELNYTGSTILSPDKFSTHIGYVKASASFALTDQNTCLQGLVDVGSSNGTIETSIAVRVNHTERIISNALEFVTQYEDEYSASNNFINASCSATCFPKLCNQSLTLYASTLVRSPHQLALFALGVSLDTADSFRAFLKVTIELNGLKGKELEAVKICLDHTSDSVHQLNRAAQELEYMNKRESKKGSRDRDFLCRMSDLQTRVSAAIIDGSECVNGFNKITKADGFSTKNKDLIIRRMTDIKRDIRNVQVLVNMFALKS